MKLVTKTKPMVHQEAALAASNFRPYFAYLMDPGLGKTKVVIDEVQSLFPLIDTVVVICPKSIVSVWKEEIDTHGVDMMHKASRWGYMETLESRPIQWFIFNVDAVNRVKTKKGINCQGFNAVVDILMEHKRSMMVIDESTIIKNPDAKRTKAVHELGALAKYRRIMTGTPIANTPLDVYSQMRFLHPTEIFKYNYFAFRNRYAVMGGYEGRQVVGYRNLEHLAAIIDKHSFRARKADCLDLPERTTQVRTVELSPATWKAYRALVDELAVEIAGKEMSIDMVVKKITKLRQLTGGWLRDDDGNVHPVGHEKLTELKHLLDECVGQKVIIWCQFVHEIMALQQIHPEFRVYHGGMSSKARDEARHAFEHGDAPGIIIQNDTGSMGLTLNAATVSIFYSNPNYPLNKQQARERNYRKGQDKPVTEYELIVMGSVDQTIYHNLQNSKSLADAIVDGGGNVNIKNILLPKVDWRASKKGHD